MTPINKVIFDKKTDINPIWIMRQAGRYLPEFKNKIQKYWFHRIMFKRGIIIRNNFTTIKKIWFWCAIIFSDILMLPYGLGQEVEFKKNFGPILGNLDLKNLQKLMK